MAGGPKASWQPRIVAGQIISCPAIFGADFVGEPPGHEYRVAMQRGPERAI